MSSDSFSEAPAQETSALERPATDGVLSMEPEGRGVADGAVWTVRRSSVTDRATLEPVWRAMSDRADHSYFTSWPWISTWLGLIGPRRRPELVEILRNGERVGLAIVCFRRHIQGRVVPVNGWFLHETGHSDIDDLTVEHNGVLADRAYADEVHERFLDYCLAELPSADTLFVSGVTEGTPLARAVEKCRKAGWNAPRVEKERPYFTVDLDRLRSEGKEYLTYLGSSTRSQIKRAIKAYEAECGPLVVRPARTPEEARAFFAELLELHNIAWQARGKEGAFAFQEILDFHLRMVPRAIVGGDVQLLRISAGDHILGVLYNFVWRGRVSSYQSGFAFSERNKLKPGLVCHTLAVKHCMEAGLSTYDFLAGNHRYKAQLSTDQGVMRWVRFERLTTKMGVLRQAREARNTLRNWKAGVAEWRARRAVAGAAEEAGESRED
jgi:CelD/BcsL family acetyltransferase involved in cellulose biosynthesis